MKCILLRFDAPMMSFGGVLVDQHNRTERFPGRSMLTGLVGNALGWDHSATRELNDLQSRIQYSARWDVPPQPLRDYHTVDLGQPHLSEPGWTTRGQPEHRAGGESRKGTHQRYRHYWADGVMTLALAVEEGVPDLDEIARALKKPQRPVFLGRKTCLPANRVFLGLRDSASVLMALQEEPRAPRASATVDAFESCWPVGEGSVNQDARQQESWSDDRDWRQQAHLGTRQMVTGYISGVP